ncbi:aminotransferase class V-fold PLP-dependent enzyme [Streptomyces flaveus]|uniref:aminotransferase class V-fold PLP-dependent enzyme n=1 Tax=Streptomyces flaveus TaxID=66370 RepID=UPI00331AA124
MGSTDPTGDDFWEGIRAAYPEQQSLLNLNNAAVSPPPLVAEQATIDAYRMVSQNPDVTMWQKLDSALPETKAQLAELIDCEPDEIALSRNSTEGLCTAIFGIPLSAGDQVVVSAWDYPSVLAAWRQRQEREGIEVVTADFDHWNLGTYNSALQAGIAPAARLHREIGVERIHARLRELTRHWVDQAQDIPGVQLHTPLDTDNLGAVTLFSIDRLDNRAVERELRDTYRVHTKYREVRHLSGLRVSPGIYMRKDELDHFVSAFRELVEKQYSERGLL